MTDAVSKLVSYSAKNPNIQFLGVIVVGFFFDILIALSCRILFALSLTTSAAIGFVCAVFLNYILFERLVFKKKKQFSMKRLLLTWASALITLAVRLSIVLGLSALLEHYAILPQYQNSFIDLAIFLGAASVSLVVNKILIFKIF